MKLTYDPEVDAVHIRFRDGVVADSDETAPGVIVDYDEAGKVLGMELLDPSDLFAELLNHQNEITERVRAKQAYRVTVPAGA